MLDSDKLDIVMLQSADMSRPTATKRLSRFYVVKGVIKYDDFASRVYKLIQMHKLVHIREDWSV